MILDEYENIIYVKSLMYLGKIYSIIEDYRGSIKQFKESLDIINDIDPNLNIYKKQKAEILSYYANCEYYIFHYEPAVALGESALKLCEEIN